MATKALARVHPFRHSYAKPIIIRPTVKAVKKHRGKRRGGGGGGGLMGGNRGKVLMGAFAVGLLQKSGIANNLPKIPLLGETGTIGLAAYFLGGKHGGLASDICTAALTIAAYELGSTGSIVGEDPDLDVTGYVAGF